MKVVLVTGSRHHADNDLIWGALGVANPDLVIEGGAEGADALALGWAMENGVAYTHWPDEHWGGTLSGPERNGKMVEVTAALVAAGWDHQVLAFPLNGSRGTWSCVRQAERAGLDVTVWQPDAAVDAQDRRG